MLILRVEKRDEDPGKIKGSAALKQEGPRKPHFRATICQHNTTMKQKQERLEILPFVKHQVVAFG